MSTTTHNRPALSRARKIAVGAVAAGAATAGIAMAAGTADAYYAYQLAPINGHAAFGIGPFGDQGSCQAHTRVIKDWGQRYSPKFGTCVYDANVGGWLLISAYAQ